MHKGEVPFSEKIQLLAKRYFLILSSRIGNWLYAKSYVGLD